MSRRTGEGSSASSPDQRYLRRAIELAERGLGETNPNPAVGCVLVRGGRVVGEGFHARAGARHAEAQALRQAGARAKGATAYVTLEPCAPHDAKRTPPCALALIDAGVKRVVFGSRDLNPRVRGAGTRLLRSAGIDLVSGVLEGETDRVTQHFNAAMKRGRPFVTLKAGMTLDGRIATSSGESQWITSRSQRAAARRLRRLFGGLLVGIETVLSDDPLLLPEPRTRRPFARVVLDSRLRLPLGSRLVRSAADHPVIAICGAVPESRRRALEQHGVRVLSANAVGGRIAIADALSLLFKQGIFSLMVEGGAEVLGSFVRSGLFDELVMFRAPLLLGGRGSKPVVGGENPKTLSEAVPMKRVLSKTSATLHYGLRNAEDLDAEVYEPLLGPRAKAHLPRKER